MLNHVAKRAAGLLISAKILSKDVCVLMHEVAWFFLLFAADILWDFEVLFWLGFLNQQKKLNHQKSIVKYFSYFWTTNSCTLSLSLSPESNFSFWLASLEVCYRSSPNNMYINTQYIIYIYILITYTVDGVDICIFCVLPHRSNKSKKTVNKHQNTMHFAIYFAIYITISLQVTRQASSKTFKAPEGSPKNACRLLFEVNLYSIYIINNGKHMNLPACQRVSQIVLQLQLVLVSVWGLGFGFGLGWILVLADPHPLPVPSYAKHPPFLLDICAPMPSLHRSLCQNVLLKRIFYALAALQQSQDSKRL